MKTGQEDRSVQRGRRNARKSRRLPVTAHPAFAPLLGVWGALLGGLPIMVLPPAAIQTAVDGTLLGTFAGLAQPVAALIAALILGTLLFAGGAAAHGRTRRSVGRPSLAERAVRRVTPINPERDLGSRRFDDPLDGMPLASPAWRDADLAAVQTMPADAPAGVPDPASDPDAAPDPDAASHAVPRELDLAAFAELPGRNAVWVEDQPQVTAAPPTAASVAAPPRAQVPVDQAPEVSSAPLPGTAALARLRAVPAEALSLPQMVERFAGALHEHRAAPHTRALSTADLAAREAALAEALKALAALSGGPGSGDDGALAGERGEPLRAALARLQPRREVGRGAA